MSLAEPFQMTRNFFDKFNMLTKFLGNPAIPVGKEFFLTKVKYENCSVELELKVPHMHRKLQQALSTA